MFRKFNDVLSTTQLKIGDEIGWVFGFKLFKSRGSVCSEKIEIGSQIDKIDNSSGQIDCENELNHSGKGRLDRGSGKIKLLESASGAF